MSRFKLMHPIDTPLKENVSGFYGYRFFIPVNKLITIVLKS